MLKKGQKDHGPWIEITAEGKGKEIIIDTTGHTPTPWGLLEKENPKDTMEKYRIIGAFEPPDEDDEKDWKGGQKLVIEMQTVPEMIANTGLVLTAVNSLDDMVLALTEAREYVAFAASQKKNSAEASETLVRVDRALAKATEGRK